MTSRLTKSTRPTHGPRTATAVATTAAISNLCKFRHGKSNLDELYSNRLGSAPATARRGCGINSACIVPGWSFLFPASAGLRADRVEVLAGYFVSTLSIDDKCETTICQNNTRCDSCSSQPLLYTHNSFLGQPKFEKKNLFVTAARILHVHENCFGSHTQVTGWILFGLFSFYDSLIKG